MITRVPDSWSPSLRPFGRRCSCSSWVAWCELCFSDRIRNAFWGPLWLWGYLLPYQDKNSEFHGVHCWDLSGSPGSCLRCPRVLFMELPGTKCGCHRQNLWAPYKMLYTTEAFTLSPTPFCIPTVTSWRRIGDYWSEEWSPKPSWVPAKPGLWEMMWGQMGVDRSAPVLQMWGLREASRWIQGLRTEKQKSWWPASCLSKGKGWILALLASTITKLTLAPEDVRKLSAPS